MLETPAPAADPQFAAIDLTDIESEALKRLIEEVRNEGPGAGEMTAYNRSYHRHNR